jgi:hypothetical protein
MSCERKTAVVTGAPQVVTRDEIVEMQGSGGQTVIFSL